MDIQTSISLYMYVFGGGPPCVTIRPSHTHTHTLLVRVELCLSARPSVHCLSSTVGPHTAHWLSILYLGNVHLALVTAYSLAQSYLSLPTTPDMTDHGPDSSPDKPASYANLSTHHLTMGGPLMNCLWFISPFTPKLMELVSHERFFPLGITISTRVGNNSFTYYLPKHYQVDWKMGRAFP